jgi:hypothetical protein
MPVVPSPDVAVDAAVGPAPVVSPPPSVVAEPEPEVAATEPDAPEPVAAPVVEEAVATAEPEAAGQADTDPEEAAASYGDGDGLGSEGPVDEPEPAAPKPWWNPTGGGSDEPHRGEDPVP